MMRAGACTALARRHSPARGPDDRRRHPHPRPPRGGGRWARGLWRGPVLGDLADLEFTRTEVARLEELRLTALEHRVDADLALGRHAEVVGELEALVLEHPLREGLHGQLMRALYGSGRQ